MKQIRYFLLVIILSPFYEISAQPALRSYNLAHQYNPESELRLNYESIEHGDTLEIYLRFTLQASKAEIDDYTFDFFTVDSYADKLQEIPKIQIDSSYRGSTGTAHLFRFSIPSESVASFIVIEAQSKFSGFIYYFDFPASGYPLMLSDTDQNVQLNSWIPPGVYNFNAGTQLNSYYYQHEFPPALPPMPVKHDIPEKTMAIDSTFHLEGNENAWFTKHGLYLVQRDSSDREGFSFRVENAFYPKLTTLEELIKPLIYITTKEENEMLQQVDGDKKAFDRFWLELTDSPERAKNIIKHYFDRVEQANRFFTTYKEGWKTDMGMIYIIFGPPDEVNKTADGESWKYLALPMLPELEFEFLKAETVFSTPHYVLLREKKYANAWFRTIDLWRKGRF